jgi:hypothetical protein
MRLQVQACPQATCDALEQILVHAVRPLLSDAVPAVVDNACGALARITVVHAARLPLPDMARGLLQALPLRVDFDETEPVVAALQLLQQQLLGQQHHEVRAGLLAALGQCACQEGAAIDIRQRAAHVLQAEYCRDSQLVESVMASLSPEQRQRVRQLALA